MKFILRSAQSTLTQVINILKVIDVSEPAIL